MLWSMHSRTYTARILRTFTDKIRLLLDGFHNSHNHLQHVRLFDALPFVRFDSPLNFYVQKIHILTQTKPNQTICSPGHCLTSYAASAAIVMRYFVRFFLSETKHLLDILLHPFFSFELKLPISTYLRCYTAHIQCAPFTKTKNFYCFSPKMPSNFNPNSTLDKHEWHELGPNACNTHTQILKYCM